MQSSARFTESYDSNYGPGNIRNFSHISVAHSNYVITTPLLAEQQVRSSLVMMTNYQTESHIIFTVQVALVLRNSFWRDFALMGLEYLHHFPNLSDKRRF
jgi:hypothetical protein